MAFGIRREEIYLLSNTSDSISSLNFCIRTWQIQQVPLLSWRPRIAAAETGQCSLFPWFPWRLDIQMLLLRSEHPDMTKQEEGCDLKHQINFLNVEGE